MAMHVLIIGDIVGRPGREALDRFLPQIRSERVIDAVIVNAENAAAGAGITSRIADELFIGGCDILTLGDHTWDKQEIIEYLKINDRIIRPANFPADTPGRGWCIWQTPAGQKIGVINLLGRVFMRYNVACPFRELRAIVDEIRKVTPCIVVDIHAEATSEKVALGHFIDGAVSAVVGTHTHVPTADETILPKGTAYITDLGMTGPYDSVIGQDKEAIVRRFLSQLPEKFQVANNDVRVSGVLVEIDELTGKALTIERIHRKIL